MRSNCANLMFFFGTGGFLRAFYVTRLHNLRLIGNIDVNTKYKHFACTLVDADIIVAFSHQTSVSLHRLVAQRLEPLSEIASIELSWLLFRGPLLLGIGRNKERKENIVSLLITESGHNLHPQVLYDFDACVQVSRWCIAGNRLVIRDGICDLLIFDFESVGSTDI